MSEEQKETNLNHILALAILALLSWNVFTTQQLSIDVAVLTSKVERLELRIKG